VLVRVAGFVDCPQEVIASEVRLEPAKERLDLLRQILAFPHSADKVFQGFSEREGAVVGVRFPGRNSDSVSSIVEGRPEITSKFAEAIPDIVQLPAKFPSWLDFMNFVVGLVRVRFDNLVVWLTVDEVGDFPLEFGKVFHSPVELAV